jgi:hypothetical protein
VTEGEPGPLDEATWDVRCDRAVRIVHPQHAERPQRAVGGLGAAIEADVGTTAVGVGADGAVLGAVGSVVVRVAVAARVVEVVRLYRGAPPNAGFGARDVVEPIAVQAANLHVFDRLGLDGKIGGLRPRDRNHTRCGAEEKTFFAKLSAASSLQAARGTPIRGWKFYDG